MGLLRRGRTHPAGTRKDFTGGVLAEPQTVASSGSGRTFEAEGKAWRIGMRASDCVKKSTEISVHNGKLSLMSGDLQYETKKVL